MSHLADAVCVPGRRSWRCRRRRRRRRKGCRGRGRPPPLDRPGAAVPRVTQRRRRERRGRRWRRWRRGGSVGAAPARRGGAAAAAGSDGGVGGDCDESDMEGKGGSDCAAAAKLPRKLIHRASSSLGRMRCCHSFRLFNSARAVWSKDVNLLILKSDALMAEKSEEAELESVSRHASCKNND